MILVVVVIVAIAMVATTISPITTVRHRRVGVKASDCEEAAEGPLLIIRH